MSSKTVSFSNQNSYRNETISTSSNEKIWQTNDLDLKKVSVVCVNRNSIRDIDLFKSFIMETEKQTNCLIMIHGLENSTNDLIWIKIKNDSNDSVINRKNAFNLINALTQNSCREIIIPSINTNAEEKFNSNKKNDHFEDENVDISTETKFKRSLTKSLTTNSIVSLTTDINKLKTSSKKRYTIEFLLSRSEMAQSKKMPNDWKRLNELYPQICFSGKVLSYFNPNKYFEYWQKVQNENHELHNCKSFRKSCVNSIHNNGFYKTKRECLTESNLKSLSASSTGSSVSTVSSNADDYTKLTNNEFSGYNTGGDYQNFSHKINKNNTDLLTKKQLFKRFDLNNNKNSDNKTNETRNLSYGFLLNGDAASSYFTSKLNANNKFKINSANKFNINHIHKNPIHHNHELTTSRSENFIRFEKITDNAINQQQDTHNYGKNYSPKSSNKS